MKKKDIHTLTKKIVEEGTSHAYTLLRIQANDKQTTTIQNAMKQSILIENNTCGHSYEILFGDFIQSKKVCKVCTSAIITALSDQQAAIKYSQHNTQAKFDV